MSKMQAVHFVMKFANLHKLIQALDFLMVLMEKVLEFIMVFL
jgi:hypothetical protein